MRLVRMAIAGALTLASSCTIWYLASDPYGCPGSGCTIASEVGAVTVYNDTLYANINGNLYVCADVDCSSLVLRFQVSDAGADVASVAVNGAGFAWNAAAGIYYATADVDAAPTLVVSDVAGTLTLDGPRISYLSPLDDAGNKILRTCDDATKGCDGGSTIVDGGHLLWTLASLPGQVGYVVTKTIETTSLADGGVTSYPLDAGGGRTVVSDGTSFIGLYMDTTNPNNKTFTIRRLDAPDASTEIYTLTAVAPNTNPNDPSPALWATSDIVVVWPNPGRLVYFEREAGTMTTLTGDAGVPGTPTGKLTANSRWFFIVGSHTLYRVAR